MGKLKQYDISGRRALVTGAGQGIGAECAATLADAGATVYCTDIDFEKAQKTTEKLVSNGLKAHAYGLDVTDSAAVDALADQLAGLDILVCNAGVVSNVQAELMSDQQWDHVIGVNLTGVFKTCRSFGSRMLQAGRGAIVNIGSISGNVVNVPQAQCHYNASKAAVHQLTKSLAVEWARRGVRVNAVAPGYIETPLLDSVSETNPDFIQRWLDLTPTGRMGTPSNVASVVLFLSSDLAAMMTGSVVTVDAGYTCV